MRKMIILGLVAMFVAASQVPAQAAPRRSGGLFGNNRVGLFARLMELERAKNQWLFGR
jgi:hypothetical protein